MLQINRYPKLLLCLALSATLFTACKKDDNNDDDSNNNNNNNSNIQAPTENKLTAKIDGTGWVADVPTINGTYVSAGGTYSLIINGEKSDGSFFTLSINLWNNQTGTFQTSATGTSNYVALTVKDSAGETYNAPVNGNSSATGTLKIDYWAGNKVSGSFSFTGGQQGNSQTVSVTNGVFSCINVQ